MGQAASRQAAKQAQNATKSSTRSAAGATTTAKAPRPPPLGRPVADAPDVIEDASLALQQRQQKEAEESLKPSSPTTTGGRARQHTPTPMPPIVDQNTGFYRGQLTDPRDVAQERFLLHQHGGQTEVPEMAPDLLKFLQEAGPLQKKVNKELTSPRIVKELERGEEGEKSEKMHRFEAAQRTRNDMLLVESIEGHSTPRTTNFFTSSLAAEEKEALSDFGLNDLEIYDLLKRSKQSADNGGFCASFYAETAASRIEVAGWTDDEQKQQHQLLRDTIQFLELPVVIKDEEANYIGMDPTELEKEFAYQKIDIVDESRVKLVLADLFDLQRKEIKRIR